jgi:hypothetical protein
MSNPQNPAADSSTVGGTPRLRFKLSRPATVDKPRSDAMKMDDEQHQATTQIPGLSLDGNGQTLPPMPTPKLSGTPAAGSKLSRAAAIEKMRAEARQIEEARLQALQAQVQVENQKRQIAALRKSKRDATKQKMIEDARKLEEEVKKQQEYDAFIRELEAVYRESSDEEDEKDGSDEEHEQQSSDEEDQECEDVYESQSMHASTEHKEKGTAQTNEKQGPMSMREAAQQMMEDARKIEQNVKDQQEDSSDEEDGSDGYDVEIGSYEVVHFDEEDEEIDFDEEDEEDYSDPEDDSDEDDYSDEEDDSDEEDEEQSSDEDDQEWEDVYGSQSVHASTERGEKGTAQKNDNQRPMTKREAARQKMMEEARQIEQNVKHQQEMAARVNELEPLLLEDSSDVEDEENDSDEEDEEDGPDEEDQEQISDEIMEDARKIEQNVNHQQEMAALENELEPMLLEDTPDEEDEQNGSDEEANDSDERDQEQISDEIMEDARKIEQNVNHQQDMAALENELEPMLLEETSDEQDDENGSDEEANDSDEREQEQISDEMMEDAPKIEQNVNHQHEMPSLANDLEPLILEDSSNMEDEENDSDEEDEDGSDQEDEEQSADEMMEDARKIEQNVNDEQEMAAFAKKLEQLRLEDSSNERDKEHGSDEEDQEDDSDEQDAQDGSDEEDEDDSSDQEDQQCEDVYGNQSVHASTEHGEKGTAQTNDNQWPMTKREAARQKMMEDARQIEQNAKHQQETAARANELEPLLLEDDTVSVKFMLHMDLIKGDTNKQAATFPNLRGGGGGTGVQAQGHHPRCWQGARSGPQGNQRANALL